MCSVADFDFVIVGGGLQGCLVVNALSHRAPDKRVLLVEQNTKLCGNHTWSFHRPDIERETFVWFKDLVDHSWGSYEVRLGDSIRPVAIPYGSISSDSLANKTNMVFLSQPNFQRLTGSVAKLSTNRLTLESGQEIAAKVVLDARGCDPRSLLDNTCGFQKFVGLEVFLESNWRSSRPCLMDDSADQSDGFRFLYSLPFSSRRVLVEDTCFSNDSQFKTEQSIDEIDRYLRREGHRSYRIIRRESGCLPMPYAKQASAASNTIGYRGGFFHPATGYSIPLAANLANEIASANPESAEDVIANLRNQKRFQKSASLFLNRMLFQLVKPHHRAEIFRRFYDKLSTEAIGRFYAHRFSSTDMLQILVGKPPSGLTPLRFINSFLEKPCPAL